MHQVKRLLFLLFSTISFIFQVYGQLLLQEGEDIYGASPGDSCGNGVTLSATGTRVAIGSPSNDDYGTSSGHVRVFEHVTGDWVQLGTDIGGEAAGDAIGTKISINAAGDRVAIGSQANDGNGLNSGHVRIFGYEGGDWIQLGSDIDGEAEGDHSGQSISLDSTGNRVAIGAAENGGSGVAAGHVRIFEYIAGNWTQLGSDIDGEAAGDYSGCSVSLNADGTRVAIGARLNNGNGSRSGHVRVFQFNGIDWIQLGQDIDGKAAEDQSGCAVSLNADGTIVAIGALYNDDNGYQSGHVRIFEYIAGTWMQLGGGINGEAETDNSGQAISLSADGSKIVIGAVQNDGNGNAAGHARIFQYIGENWIQVGEDIDGEAAYDSCGRSVSISANGTYVAVGASGNDNNGSSSGQVRIFTIPTNFYVNIDIIGNGSVTFTNGFYEPGTNLVFSPVPDEGWLFVEWQGDIMGDFNTAYTNVLVDDYKFITAVFSDDADGDGILNTNETTFGTNPRESDSDFDGLNDYAEIFTYFTDPVIWDTDIDGLSDGSEINIYGSNPNVLDSDGDGFNDGYEVSTGYDPTSTNSTPELYSLIKTSIQFEFHASTGQTYRIEGTPHLSDPWSVIENGIEGTGGLITRHYDVDLQTNRFFRAKRD